MLKESTDSQKSFKKLNRLRFSCPSDANQALQIWLKSHAFVAINNSEIIKHPVFKQSGRPKLGQIPDSYEYQITGQLYYF